jgi:amino acid adenylation domain-containing protein
MIVFPQFILHQLSSMLLQGSIETMIEKEIVNKHPHDIAVDTKADRSFDGSKVSVIIPAYNSAKFLPEAIESVLSQTYPVFEIVVVDDGSTDETKAVCDRYPKIKYIYQSNQGLIGARNTGIRVSAGEYLLFFDSDDYLLPKAVEIGVNSINAHPEAGFVFGNYIFQSINPDGSYETEEIYDNQHIVANYENILAGKLKMQCACVLFRRTVIESVGEFDPNSTGAEDYNLFLRVAREFPIHFHGQTVLEYRYNGSNMSAKPTYLINTLRAHKLQWSYIEQTGNKHYEVAYEQGRQAWIKLFVERLPYEVMKYAQSGQWIKALGNLRLISYYDRKLSCIDKEIYEVSYKALIEKLRQLPIESSLAYWKQQLAGAPPLLPIPTDRPRSPNQDFRGNSTSFSLNQELTEALSSLSRLKGVTLFMSLLAAFDTLLYRYTGTEDVIVGSPIAKQIGSETFVNAVVLRTDMSGNPSFQELLDRVLKVSSEAYTHQDLPFEILIEEFQLQRDLSYPPLFQVTFGFEEDVSLEKLYISSLTASPWVLENNEGKFDLSLYLKQTNHGLEGKWVYNADLFDPETIERINGHFQILLEGIVANPSQPIAQLPLLTLEERQQLLFDWNNTQIDYSQDKSIHQIFEEQVERNPDAVAVVFEQQQLTYRELNDRANQLANYLIDLGICADTLVGLCVERSLDIMVGILGILKAGGAYVPLDPSNPQDRLEYILGNAQVRILVTQSGLLNILPVCEQMICLDRDRQTIAQYPQTNPFSRVERHNLAYIIYTSGSTGQPKGVLVNHDNVVRLFTATESWYHFNETDVWTLFHSFAFDFSVWEIWGALLYGGRVVVVSYLVSRDTEAFHNLLVSEQVTVLNQTPSAFYQLIEADKYSNLSERLSLRLVIFGGEALNLTSLQPWFERHGDNLPQLVNMYGITETTVHVTYRPLTLADVKVTGSLIGRPIPDLQIYLLDPHRQPVPIGVHGEMYVGGAGVAQGYWQRDELTQERFIPNPFSPESNARLYKSGDLARYLKDGSLEYIGRIDNQVKIRGFRIELGEIEALVSQHPEIAQAVVLVSEYIPGDKRLVAYLVPNQGQNPTINGLHNFLSQKLPSYMVPSAFVILDALPLTSNGKVDRKALPTPDQNSLAIDRSTLSTPDRDSLAGSNAIGLAPEDSFVAPRTPTEEILAAIWAQVLGLNRVSIHDNFFLLGGHSLLATKIMLGCRQAFSIELPLRELFQSPTVASLAQAITQYQNQVSELSEHQAIPRRGDRDSAPLSFPQQRLWFLHQLDPNRSDYHFPFALNLTGSLNVTALQQSLDAIVARHEVLRTNFVSEDGNPVQVIRPPQPVELQWVDLQKYSQSEREVEVKRRLLQESKRTFNLSQDLMLRGFLFKLAPEEHILLLAMHHIATDGESMGVFSSELKELYTAFCNGQSPTLSELPIQYADFAAWQQQCLRGESLQTLQAYWQQQMVGAPELLALPTDRSRPALQTFRGSSQSFSLSEDLTQSLRLLSRKEGATLFMTLLAAFNALLFRYTGSEDIVVGSPIANRNRQEIEGLIGFFVNTLALRSDVSGNPSFQQLLARVREVALGAYTHQDLPFEMLVEVLQSKRDLSYSPIFQVMFVFNESIALSNLELPGLTVSPRMLDDIAAQVDLILFIEQPNNELLGKWIYNTDLFDADTIERMNGHFQTLLTGIVDNPKRAIAELPLLTVAEQQQLLVEWNDTQTEYPQNKYIHQLFEEQVERTPDAIAVVFEQQQLTYRELNNRANQLAHHLKRLGVESEILVGICLERSLEMVLGLLGILKAGGAYVPLDPAYPPERLAYMLSDSQVPVLLGQQKSLAQLPEFSGQVVRLDTDWHFMAVESSQNLTDEVNSKHLSYVIYTSGSTGRPKGVLVAHQGLCNLAKAQIKAFNVQPSSRVLQFASFSFDASISEIVMTLCSGAALYLGKPDVLMPGKALKQLLQEQAITHVTLSPSALAAIEHEELPTLETIIVAGEACPATLVTQWSKGRNFFNAYGPTESTVCATIFECNESGEKPPIGYPIDNIQVYILDRNLKLVPIGVPGELFIGGVGLARGYLNRPDLTAEKFIPNPFPFKDSASDRLYKTGDLARYLRDGNIEYLGRIDQQVKLRGFRIEPGEIETVLSQYPLIGEAAVIVKEDIPGDKRLVAYIVFNQEQVPTPSQLRQFLLLKLPDYMVPSTFVFLDALPLTPNGKVDRRALTAVDTSQRNSTETFVAAQDELEQELTKIWEQVLGIQPIGIRDDFFELGGHSLLAVRLFDRIEKKYGRNLPLATLFKAPTIEQLANFINQENFTEELWDILVPLQTDGSRIPLFCMHGGGFNVLIYRYIAQYLGTDQPVYALQAQGLDGKTSPHNSIEEMAEEYIKRIRTVQPEGPYVVGGLSYGGMIALEVAQQLMAKGQPVALVAMFDTSGPDYYKLLPPIPRLFSTLNYVLHYTFPRFLQKSSEVGVQSIAKELLKRLKRFNEDNFNSQVIIKQSEIALNNTHQPSSNRKLSLEVWIENFRQLIIKNSPLSYAAQRMNVTDSEGSVSLTLEQLHQKQEEARSAYQANSYKGKIAVFKATEQPPGYYNDPQFGWGEIAKGGLEIYDVPGFHVGVVESPILAEKLRICLDKASDNDSLT